MAHSRCHGVVEAIGKYYVSILCTDGPQVALPGAAKETGVKDLFILSDDVIYSNHKYPAKSEKSIKKTPAAALPKAQGSKPREKKPIGPAGKSDVIRV